jgi:uncharacterized protein YecT (DUF1311 family)
MFRFLKSFGLLTLFAVSFCTCAYAEDENGLSATYNACIDKSGGNTLGMLDCMAAETNRQDLLLNKAYREVMALLTRSKLDARKARLIAVEQLWIKYRDAKCGYETAMDEVPRLASAACLMSMTADRVKELEAERDGLK